MKRRERLTEAQREEMQAAVLRVIELVGDDPKRDGLKKTPKRVAEAWEFLTKGYGQDPKQVLNSALFESDSDDMVIVKDIDFYSMCEHHMLPFFGRAHVAYIPEKKIIGLSKIPKIVEVFARRLQVQERLTMEIAHTLKSKLKPKGVAVVLEARHLCMEMRGAESHHSPTTTSCMLGVFQKDARTRKEFLELVRAKPV